LKQAAIAKLLFQFTDLESGINLPEKESARHPVKVGDVEAARFDDDFTPPIYNVWRLATRRICWRSGRRRRLRAGRKRGEET
jgi:hypothetical protein